MQTFCHIPEGFHLHPKLQKWLQDRLKMLDGNVDWSTAEALGLGSMLLEGIPIRLAGEDCQRGTFSQRHMVWSDAANGSPYCPFSKLKARFDCINSPLTEYAGLGFEYGYSCGAPEALVLWEAQYGDFDNGAQIIIDQYIASAEQKWNVGSSIALLLPHAYEGAGPEHSSARHERLLQLCANDNMQVVNASTPAQYFHLLRRQGLRKVKKPLVVMTPKSLLRASACVSPIAELTKGSFQEVLSDPNPPKEVKRVILCSGKIFYDLVKERADKKILILRIEQFYPFAEEKIKAAIGNYKEYVWVQEEPENMGAWSFLQPKLASILPKGATLKWISRPENSTPATGSHTKHKIEQKALIERALDAS